MTARTGEENLSRTVQELRSVLSRAGQDNRSVVVMTCGIAGSGKTSLAKEIAKQHDDFTRISMDEIIFARHGLYGVDYTADEGVYEEYLDEADGVYLESLRSLLGRGKNFILEKSLYAKEDRDGYKKMIEEAGARWVLLYLKAVSKEALWQRICVRARRDKDANSALAISRDRFDMYWGGFEEPQGEGEVVIEVALEAELATETSTQ